MLKDFLYPEQPYRGDGDPELSQALLDFSRRIAYLINLESNGKLKPEEAYEGIKSSVKELKKLKKEYKKLLEGETDEDQSSES